MEIGYSNTILTQVFTEVRFGRPSKDCRNMGICRIEALTYGMDLFERVNRAEPRTAIAVFSVSSTTLLEGLFLKASIGPDTRRTFFDPEYFRVDERFEFPVGLMDASIPGDLLKISPGSYRISELAHYYLIDFSKK